MSQTRPIYIAQPGGHGAYDTVSSKEVKKLYRSGKIRPEQNVWDDVGQQWVAAKEFFDRFRTSLLMTSPLKKKQQREEAQSESGGGFSRAAMQAQIEKRKIEQETGQIPMPQAGHSAHPTQQTSQRVPLAQGVAQHNALAGQPSKAQQEVEKMTKMKERLARWQMIIGYGSLVPIALLFLYTAISQLFLMPSVAAEAGDASLNFRNYIDCRAIEVTLYLEPNQSLSEDEFIKKLQILAEGYPNTFYRHPYDAVYINRGGTADNPKLYMDGFRWEELAFAESQDEARQIVGVGLFDQDRNQIARKLEGKVSSKMIPSMAVRRGLELFN